MLGIHVVFNSWRAVRKREILQAELTAIGSSEIESRVSNESADRSVLLVDRHLLSPWPLQNDKSHL